MQQYRAIMMDVDGTLSNYSSSNLPLMPTQPVVDAIQSARAKFYIGIATSRPLVKMRPILEAVGFNCYCILHNGAQIIDPKTLETRWTKPINHAALRPLYEIATEYKVQLYFSNFASNLPISSYDELSTNPVADVFFDGVDTQVIQLVYEKLGKIPEIAVHRLSSRWENKYELSITHIDATKNTAIQEVARLLGISPIDFVGIGDAHNDIPLLEACGFKVAMGNAVEEVKRMADFIAPSVEEDGVKTVIEKFSMG